MSSKLLFVTSGLRTEPQLILAALHERHHAVTSVIAPEELAPAHSISVLVTGGVVRNPFFRIVPTDESKQAREEHKIESWAKHSFIKVAVRPGLTTEALEDPRFWEAMRTLYRTCTQQAKRNVTNSAHRTKSLRRRAVGMFVSGPLPRPYCSEE